MSEKKLRENNSVCPYCGEKRCWGHKTVYCSKCGKKIVVLHNRAVPVSGWYKNCYFLWEDCSTAFGIIRAVRITHVECPVCGRQEATVKSKESK